MANEQLGRDAVASELSRRRLLIGAGGIAAVGALAAVTAGGVLLAQSTPQPQLVVDDAGVQRLIELSRTLCGGGSFNSAQAKLLLDLLADDTQLSRGFVDLQLTPLSAGTTPALSPQAQAAMQAILLFWYVGELNGQPISDRSTAFYQLTAWQAMYTPPYAVCKAYGAWADAPAETPAVPAI